MNHPKLLFYQNHQDTKDDLIEENLGRIALCVSPLQ